MPYLVPVLAIEGGVIGQLVFVLIALLAWVLREAAERRARRAGEERGEGPASAESPPTVMARLAALLDPDVDGEGGGLPRGRPRGETPPPIPESGPQARPRASDQVVGGTTFHALEPRLETQLTAEPDEAVRVAAREPAWSRLGLGRPEGRRHAVRKAILWSEVLGPPRAIAGPHRTPLQRRARSR